MTLPRFSVFVRGHHPHERVGTQQPGGAYLDSLPGIPIRNSPYSGTPTINRRRWLIGYSSD